MKFTKKALKEAYQLKLQYDVLNAQWEAIRPELKEYVLSQGGKIDGLFEIKEMQGKKINMEVFNTLTPAQQKQCYTTDIDIKKVKNLALQENIPNLVLKDKNLYTIK